MAPLSSLGLAGAGRSYYKICQESSTIPSDSAIGSQGAEDLLDNVGYESFCDSERDADSLFFLRGGGSLRRLPARFPNPARRYRFI